MLSSSGRTDTPLVAACQADSSTLPSFGAGGVLDKPTTLPIPGLPIFWLPEFVVAKIRQSWGWLSTENLTQRNQYFGHRDGPSEASASYERSLGLVVQDISTRIKCPSCDEMRTTLIWDEINDCWTCTAGQEGGCAPRRVRPASALLSALGRLQFVLLIGLTGARVTRQQRRVMKEAHYAAGRAMHVGDIWALGLAGMMLDIDPNWRLKRVAAGHRNRAPKHGPLWRAMRPWMMEAIVYEMLAPNSYIRRYYRWLAAS